MILMQVIELFLIMKLVLFTGLAKECYIRMAGGWLE